MNKEHKIQPAELSASNADTAVVRTQSLTLPDLKTGVRPWLHVKQNICKTLAKVF